MSEFSSPPPGAIAQEIPPSPPLPAPREGLLQRRLLWGLTLPWLAGFGLIIALAGVHFLVPDAPCWFRSHPITDSDFTRSLIPVTSDH